MKNTLLAVLLFIGGLCGEVFAKKESYEIAKKNYLMALLAFLLVLGLLFYVLWRGRRNRKK